MLIGYDDYFLIERRTITKITFYFLLAFLAANLKFKFLIKQNKTQFFYFFNAF